MLENKLFSSTNILEGRITGNSQVTAVNATKGRLQRTGEGGMGSRPGGSRRDTLRGGTPREGHRHMGHHLQDQRHRLILLL